MSFVYGANSGGNAFDSSGFKPTWAQDASGYVTELVNDKLYRTTDKTVTYGAGRFGVRRHFLTEGRSGFLQWRCFRPRQMLKDVDKPL